MHSKQPHLTPRLPVLAKQCARLFENLGIDLRGVLERVRAGDGREIFVAQLQLHGAGVQLVLPQTAKELIDLVCDGCRSIARSVVGRKVGKLRHASAPNRNMHSTIAVR